MILNIGYTVNRSYNKNTLYKNGKLKILLWRKHRFALHFYDDD
jgi:hypothetical protein